MSDIEGFDALLRRMHALGETKPLMRGLQLATIKNAQGRVHRKTGLLQRRILPGRLTNDTAVIEARTPYAAALELGARAHVIVPKRARVLAWGGATRLSGRRRSGSSATHFAKKVNHPGNRPYPYLVPGAEDAVADVGIQEVVKRWNGAA